MIQDFTGICAADTVSVMPADSAFSGFLMLPKTVGKSVLMDPAVNVTVFEEAVIAACIIAFLFAIGSIIYIMPNLLACVIRWREAINLEFSMKTARTRDRVAALCIVPFSLLVHFTGIFDPAFLPSGRETHLLSCLAAVLAYGVLRCLLYALFKLRCRSPKQYRFAGKSFLTFFILLTALLLVSAGVLRFLPVGPSVAKTVILYETALAYLVFLVRKSQIMAASYPFFRVFLYLCALEFLPTGCLVAVALVF